MIPLLDIGALLWFATCWIGYVVYTKLAARHFNDGMRAYYFVLAELSWFFHPWAFLFSTAWVVLVLYRREFHSKALAILE